jgi:DNA-binding beta-propeller fold protein YncE
MTWTLRVSLFMGAVMSGLLLPPAASASPFGSLTQLPGRNGCVQHSEPQFLEPCVRGRGLRGATSVVVSPDGRNVYATSFDGIAVFARDRATGGLTQLAGGAGCVQSGENPLRDGGCALARGSLFSAGSVAVSPDGLNVYSVLFGSVGVFARDPTTGELTQLADEAGCIDPSVSTCARARGLGAAGHVAVSGDGLNVYFASYNSAAVAVFARDPATGALTQPPGRAACVSIRRDEGCARGRALGGAEQVAVSPDGRTVYVAAVEGASVLARDRRTGALTQLTGRRGCVSRSRRECLRAPGLGHEVMSVTPGPDGRSVYVGSTSCNGICRGSVSLFTRNARTGALTRPRATSACASERGEKACRAARRLAFTHAIAISPEGRSAYAVGGVNVVVFRRNLRTGALKQLRRRFGVARGRGLSDSRSVAVSPDGRNVYVASEDLDAVAVFARR